MSEEARREIWSRHLDGESLTELERRELIRALETDPEFRWEALEDFDLHRTLRSLMRVEPDGDSFARSFSKYLGKERDATRFLKKVESGIAAGPPPAGDASGKETATIPRRRTRRWRFGRGGDSGRAPWVAGLAAAGVLLGVVVLAGVISSNSRSKGREKTARKDRLPERPNSAERESAASQARVERERLEEEYAAKEDEKRRLAKAREQAKDEKEREELKAREADLVRTIEAFRAKVEAAKKREDETQAAVAKAVETPPSLPVPQEKPAPASQGTKVALGKIEKAEEAYAVTGGGKTLLKGGEELLAGQGIEVGEKGSAVLIYLDKTRLEFGPGSEVKDFKGEGGKRVWVARGEVRGVVAKQAPGQPMVFVTPHGEAKVVGTTLRIVVDPDPKKGTRLEVEEGKVEFTRKLDGRTVDVLSGHYAVAAAGVELAARPLFLFSEDFSDPREFSSRWLTYTNGPANQTAVEEGVLRMRPENPKDIWEVWYATTRKSFPLGRLKVSARIRYSHENAVLVGAICLFPESDSGRGDRDHIEVHVRDGNLRARSMRYEKGVEVVSHSMLPPGFKFGGANRWIAVELIADRQNVTVKADGVELYSGPHKIANYQRIRPAFEAWLRNGSGEPFLVEFDDLHIEEVR